MDLIFDSEIHCTESIATCLERACSGESKLVATKLLSNPHFRQLLNEPFIPVPILCMLPHLFFSLMFNTDCNTDLMRLGQEFSLNCVHQLRSRDFWNIRFPSRVILSIQKSHLWRSDKLRPYIKQSNAFISFNDTGYTSPASLPNCESLAITLLLWAFRPLSRSMALSEEWKLFLIDKINSNTTPLETLAAISRICEHSRLHADRFNQSNSYRIRSSQDTHRQEVTGVLPVQAAVSARIDEDDLLSPVPLHPRGNAANSRSQKGEGASLLDYHWLEDVENALAERVKLWLEILVLRPLQKDNISDLRRIQMLLLDLSYPILRMCRNTHSTPSIVKSEDNKSNFSVSLTNLDIKRILLNFMTIQLLIVLECRSIIDSISANFDVSSPSIPLRNSRNSSEFLKNINNDGLLFAELCHTIGDGPACNPDCSAASDFESYLSGQNSSLSEVWRSIASIAEYHIFNDLQGVNSVCPIDKPLASTLFRFCLVLPSSSGLGCTLLISNKDILEEISADVVRMLTYDLDLIRGNSNFFFSILLKGKLSTSHSQSNMFNCLHNAIKRAIVVLEHIHLISYRFAFGAKLYSLGNARGIAASLSCVFEDSCFNIQFIRSLFPMNSDLIALATASRDYVVSFRILYYFARLITHHKVHSPSPLTNIPISQNVLYSINDFARDGGLKFLQYLDSGDVDFSVVATGKSPSVSASLFRSLFREELNNLPIFPSFSQNKKEDEGGVSDESPVSSIAQPCLDLASQMAKKPYHGKFTKKDSQFPKCSCDNNEKINIEIHFVSDSVAICSNTLFLDGLIPRITSEIPNSAALVDKLSITSCVFEHFPNSFPIERRILFEWWKSHRSQLCLTNCQTNDNKDFNNDAHFHEIYKLLNEEMSSSIQNNYIPIDLHDNASNYHIMHSCSSSKNFLHTSFTQRDHNLCEVFTPKKNENTNLNLKKITYFNEKLHFIYSFTSVTPKSVVIGFRSVFEAANLIHIAHSYGYIPLKHSPFGLAPFIQLNVGGSGMSSSCSVLARQEFAIVNASSNIARSFWCLPQKVDIDLLDLAYMGPVFLKRLGQFVSADQGGVGEALRCWFAGRIPETIKAGPLFGGLFAESFGCEELESFLMRERGVAATPRIIRMLSAKVSPLGVFRPLVELTEFVRVSSLTREQTFAAFSQPPSFGPLNSSQPLYGRPHVMLDSDLKSALFHYGIGRDLNCGRPWLYCHLSVFGDRFVDLSLLITSGMLAPIKLSSNAIRSYSKITAPSSSSSSQLGISSPRSPPLSGMSLGFASPLPDDAVISCKALPGILCSGLSPNLVAAIFEAVSPSLPFSSFNLRNPKLLRVISAEWRRRQSQVLNRDINLNQNLPSAEDIPNLNIQPSFSDQSDELSFSLHRKVHQQSLLVGLPSVQMVADPFDVSRQAGSSLSDELDHQSSEILQMSRFSAPYDFPLHTYESSVNFLISISIIDENMDFESKTASEGILACLEEDNWLRARFVANVNDVNRNLCDFDAHEDAGCDSNLFVTHGQIS